MNFFIRCYVMSSDGVISSVDEDWLPLEGGQFGFLRYKSCDGLESVGKPKMNYVETYAESESARVYLGQELAHEQTSVTLTLYFFGSDPNLSSGALSENEASQSEIKAASVAYNKFREKIDGKFVRYYDDYRQREVLLYLSDAVSMTTDRLHGVVYKEVQFKFTNVFGKSFSHDDASVIDDYISSNGKG